MQARIFTFYFVSSRNLILLLETKTLNFPVLTQLGFFIQLVLMEVTRLYHMWFLRSWEERGGNISTPEWLRTLPRNLSLVTNFFMQIFWFQKFARWLAASGAETEGNSMQNIKLNKKDICCSIIMWLCQVEDFEKKKWH